MDDSNTFHFNSLKIFCLVISTEFNFVKKYDEGL